MHANQLTTAERIVLLETKSFIEHHLSTELSLDTLAKKHATNKAKLKSGFKLLFHCSVHQYIIRKRMEKAKQFLLQTDKPIKEICHLVGYKQRTFFAAFKTYFGDTPTAVRTQKGEDLYLHLF